MPKPWKHTEFTEPESPQCTHCGGRDLMTCGSAHGRRRYRCRDCRRSSYGGTTPVEFPCPYCRGRCVKAGSYPSGSKRYLCRACGKPNANLWPSAPRSPGGPFRHRVTLYLGPAAASGLDRYCQATGLSPVQAAREVFRRAAQGPVSLVATMRPEYDRDGRFLEWVVTGAPRRLPETPIRFAHERFPNLVAQTNRKRMRRPGEERYQPTVYVVWRVAVLLDDLAKDGLCRTMHAQDLTHQEAARYLLANARPPGGARPAGPGRHV